MANSLESSVSSLESVVAPAVWGGLKLRAVAMMAALAGGVAAAWWYRNTLEKLNRAEEDGTNPHFGIPKDEGLDEA